MNKKVLEMVQNDILKYIHVGRVQEWDNKKGLMKMNMRIYFRKQW